jgi:tRNA pseudouridine55 synthase
MNNTNISGLLLLDKPKGITSFRAITKLKTVLCLPKVGHCGTLDPDATGLLLVVIGNSTKFQYELTQSSKVYLCSFILGVTSSTNDLSGTITWRQYISNVNIKQLNITLKTFEGTFLQIPPMYSAVKYNGRKLYEFARNNITIKRKARKITIYKINLLAYSANIIYIRVYCSKGTYIRSLVRDIGKIYGCGAVVKTLRRERIGKFDVKNAVTFQILNNNSSIIYDKYFITYEALSTLSKHKWFEDDQTI